MQLTINLIDETGDPLDVSGATVDVNGGGGQILPYPVYTVTLPDNIQVPIEILKPGYYAYANTLRIFDEDLNITIRLAPVVNNVNAPNYKKPYPFPILIPEPCTYNVHVFNGTSTPEGEWSYYLNNVLVDAGSKNTVINLFAAKSAQIKQRIYVKDNQTQQPLWDRQYATVSTGNTDIGVLQDIAVYLAQDPPSNANVETIEYKPELALSASQESGCSDEEACYNALSEVVVTPNFVLNSEIPAKPIVKTEEITILSGDDFLLGIIKVLPNTTYEAEIDVSQDTTDLVFKVTDENNVNIIAPTVLSPGVNNISIPLGANDQIKTVVSNTDGLNVGVLASFSLIKPAYYKCAESTITYEWFDFEGNSVLGPVTEPIDNDTPPNPDTLQTKYTPDGIGDYKVKAVLTNCCTSCTKELIIPVCSFFKISETGCNEITIQNCSLDKNLSVVTIVDATTQQPVDAGKPYPIVLVPGASEKISFGKDGIYKITLQYGDPVVTKYVSVTTYCNLKACLSDYLTDILCDECDCECGGVSLEKAYFLNKLVVSSYAYFMGLNNEYNFNNIYNALNGSPPDGDFNDAVKDLLDLDFVKEKMDKYCKQKDCGKKNPCGCK